MPIFDSLTQRQQAEQLMQPCLIRVIDNLRKQLEETPWQSTYREYVLWPAGTTEEQQNQVKTIAAQLDTASPEDAVRLRNQLETLPHPLPAYDLQLSYEDSTVSLNIWEICYQICFIEYQPDKPAQVDPQLLDETGDVDWIQLDQKAKQLITTVFQELPLSKSS